jgi:drug/metabolite transporter (DMT)-like permease
VFGTRRPLKTTFAGATLALVGVVVVFEEGIRFSSDWITGDLLLGVSVLAWSVLTLLSRPLVSRLPKFALTRVTLLGGTAMLLPITISDLVAFDFGSLSWRSAACIAFLGVFTSVLSYLNWYYLLSRIGPVRCGMLLTLQPVSTALLASAILDEPLTGQLAVGGVVVLAGLMVVHLSEARVIPAPGAQDHAGSSDSTAAATAQQSAAITKK